MYESLIIISIFEGMKTTRKTLIVQDVMKLGIKPNNAYRIVYQSKGQAAKALVRLIEDLHSRGIIVVIS
jgi:hypothetical protein